MVPLLRNVVDWHTPPSLDGADLQLPTTPTSAPPSLLNAQEHCEIVVPGEERDDDDVDEEGEGDNSDYSIPDSREGALTTDDDDDDDESLPDAPLSLGGDHRAQLSLRAYHQRLDRGYIHKQTSARSLRLQEAHRIEMLKRRMRDLETRNDQLKQKASTLKVQRDAVALQEQQDRERVRQLEEQLAALQQALSAH